MPRLTTLFSFRERASRLAYWRTQLWTSLALALLWIVTIFVAMGAGDLAAIPLLLGLPVLVVSLAVLVRRLHDRDKSGWWLLLFWAAPAACFAAAQLATEQTGEGGPLAVAGVAAGLVLELWAIIEVGFRRGSKGANRYGPPPAAR